MSASLEADVVIIGSGVAGSLIAWRLAEAKLKVLILEAGPRIDRVEAFKSYLAARDKHASAPYPPAPYAPAPQYNSWNDYYINTGPDLFRGLYTRGLGGSTWHWAGSVLRYRQSDFRMKSRFAWRTERELTLGSTAETLPDPNNRIVPDETKMDAIGIPRPRIHYRIDEYAKAGLGLAIRRHEAIFAALQSTQVETLPMVTSSGTIVGTTRMGNNPRESAVGRDLRAHDHANLFIVGGMVFPTAGMHPPTLSIAALALRATLAIKQSFAGLQ